MAAGKVLEDEMPDGGVWMGRRAPEGGDDKEGLLLPGCLEGHDKGGDNGHPKPAQYLRIFYMMKK